MLFPNYLAVPCLSAFGCMLNKFLSVIDLNQTYILSYIIYHMSYMGLGHLGQVL